MLITKMDPEVKAEWVAALRSGKYKQTYGTLCDIPGKVVENGLFPKNINTSEANFCCLGVLAHIQGRLHKYLVQQHYLAKEDVEEFGISKQKNLADMNDRGHTFEYIATHIQENL